MFLTKTEADKNDREYEDRRIFARFKAEIIIRCLEKKSESRCLTMDISAQGLGILSPEGFKPEARVEIYLKLPETKEEFVTEGTIVWCRKLDEKKFRMGVLLEKPELMIVSQLLNSCSNAPRLNH